MKRKQLFAFVLILVLVFSICISSFADDAEQKDVSEKEETLAAEELYEKAARLYYVDYKYDEAYQLVKDAEEKGYTPLIRLLASCYDYKYSKITNDDEALRLFSIAADAGDIISKYRVAIYTEQGRGIAKNPETAQKMYCEIFEPLNEEYENGSDNYIKGTLARYIAQYYEYGDGNVEQNIAEAIKYYETAVELGNSPAMQNLGAIYAGGKGVEQDYGKAKSYYEAGCKAGNAASMNDLGLLYANGNGVVQDYAKAKELFEQAAELNESAAMNNLGMIYYYGYGVSPDKSAALEWFNKSASLGNKNAEKNLEELF